MRLANGGTLLAALVVASLVAVAGGAGTAAVAAQEDCSFPISQVDATGTEVTVEGEPERIVTLSPSAAQTMWEIGATDKVVGVTKYADYLDGAEEKRNISGSGYTTIVPEKVVAAEPDLVLAPNIVSDEAVESLRERGLTVYKFRASENLEDIVAKTELTGRLVGACEGTGETAAEMESDLALIEQTVAGEDRPLVLYEFSGGYTAGEGTFVHSLIETAGGRNLAAEAGVEGYQPISEETVVERDPEFLIQTTRSPDPPASTAYNETTAVREGNIVVVNTDYLNQPAPRTVDAVRKMVKA
ncbi:MAG: PGF-CTERM-anchored ABC transporter substrate-binding protein, partial [Halobacteriales archaeon]